jgi:hypothetical protein
MADTGNSLIHFSDVVIATCTLLGPVLAVQAQKWVERFREKQQRRLTIFRTLMATRALNLSPQHVEAINSVPIDFYQDKSVIDAWEEYFDHLSRSGEGDAVWGQKRVDLFVKLLAAIAKKVGYNFNVAEMNRIYFPRAHGMIEEDANIIRKGAAAMFKGEFALPLAIKTVPTSQEAADLQSALTEKMSRAYAPDGSLKVTIQSQP